jgi:prevent-host-death family protein
MSEKTLAVSEARQEFLRIVERARKTMDRYVVTKKGKPEATILSYRDYQTLLETSRLIRNPALLKKLQRAAVHAERGQTTALEEIEKKRR